MIETLRLMDTEKINFGGMGLPLQIVLGFVMFGVALGITPGHFRDVAKNPRLVILGVLSQFLLLPAFTFLLVIISNQLITPTVALGMILVAACPGGNISNFITSLAKGNVALSVTLTAIATLAAIFMTPLNFALWGKLYLNFAPAHATSFLRELTIDPYEMFKTVFILLGVPLIIGMWFNHKFPALTSRIIKPIRNISVIIFMAMVVGMFAANYSFFVRFILYIFIVVFIHNFVALATGFSLASIFKTDRPSRRSISIETGIQNSGLGLVLLTNPAIFPGHLEIGGMAFIAGWWGIWHIISGLGIAYFWSKIPYEDRFRWKYIIPERLLKGKR